jgi:hypothetical protein
MPFLPFMERRYKSVILTLHSIVILTLSSFPFHDPIQRHDDPSKQASRAQILKKAAEYIQSMRKKNSSHQQDIDDLRKQNKVLEEQSESLSDIALHYTRSAKKKKMDVEDATQSIVSLL